MSTRYYAPIVGRILQTRGALSSVILSCVCIHDVYSHSPRCCLLSFFFLHSRPSRKGTSSRGRAAAVVKRRRRCREGGEKRCGDEAWNDARRVAEKRFHMIGPFFAARRRCCQQSFATVFCHLDISSRLSSGWNARRVSPSDDVRNFNSWSQCKWSRREGMKREIYSDEILLFLIDQVLTSFIILLWLSICYMLKIIIIKLL